MVLSQLQSNDFAIAKNFTKTTVTNAKTVIKTKTKTHDNQYLQKKCLKPGTKNHKNSDQSNQKKLNKIQ